MATEKQAKSGKIPVTQVLGSISARSDEIGRQRCSKVKVRVKTRVRRDPGTRPVPNFFSSTRPVPTRKLKMTGYRVIKFLLERNKTQSWMKNPAIQMTNPINPGTGNHFLSFFEESDQEQAQ